MRTQYFAMVNLSWKLQGSLPLLLILLDFHEDFLKIAMTRVTKNTNLQCTMVVLIDLVSRFSVQIA